MSRISAIFAVMLLIFSYGISGHSLPMKETGGLTLRIIHTNDMHARFEQTSNVSTRCLPDDAAANKCYGGLARIATLVRQARNSSTPTIFLNAGDTYQGSGWFNVHKWKIVSKFLNLLSPDAISLGNHEFDHGVAGLVPFINAATFPIVTANLDLRDEPDLAASKLQNSTILTVKGTKIGIIGYLTPETKIISSTGKVKFTDEVESIKREVAKLRKEGVKIFIAVGHSGFAIDKKIAVEVDGISIVIGGHTNTFLYTGKHPDLEVPEGLYPTEVSKKNGRKAYVVQAYAYTKYLGNITVDFDGNGEVTKILGNPILVDSKIEQAKDILDELENWRTVVDEVEKKIVGSTKVHLDGDSKSCRRKECNLGNLLCDAMVYYNARQYNAGKGWTDAAIAILVSGLIRTSIVKSSDGKITAEDVRSVVPFPDGLMKITVDGSELLEVLEWGVRTLQWNNTAELNGAFLQVSGLQVSLYIDCNGTPYAQIGCFPFPRDGEPAKRFAQAKWSPAAIKAAATPILRVLSHPTKNRPQLFEIIYDLSQPYGSRVNSVKVRCADCTLPSYRKLDNKAHYTILIPAYMQRGGDGFSMLTDVNYTAVGTTIHDLLVDYLMTKSPVYPRVEGRIGYLIKTGGHETVISEPSIVPDHGGTENADNTGGWRN